MSLTEKPSEGSTFEGDKASTKTHEKGYWRHRLRHCWKRLTASKPTNKLVYVKTVPGHPRVDAVANGWIDRRDWETAQANFPGPLGQYYEPNDPNKPEVYMWSDLETPSGLIQIPAYQHRSDDDRNLPPYEWARLCNLPTPITVDDSWASLLAAQREKSRLIETQSYIASRSAEIDRRIKAVMDTKVEQHPHVARHFISAQVVGTLLSVGLDDQLIPLLNALQAGHPPVDDAELHWRLDVEKQFVLRESLSPLSFLP